MLEERHGRQPHAELLEDPVDQLDGQQRVPAEIEEVVGAPYRGHREQLAPDGRQARFGGCDRMRLPGGGGNAGRWIGQGAHVELAAGGKRERVDGDESPRHHVVGKERGAGALAARPDRAARPQAASRPPDAVRRNPSAARSRGTRRPRRGWRARSRSRPAQPGSRGSLPARRAGRGTRGRRSPGIGHDRPSDTTGRGQTGWARTARAVRSSRFTYPPVTPAPPT